MLDAQKSAIADALIAKWGDHECSVCGSSAGWLIHDAFQLRLSNGALPAFVPVECKTCGHTSLFSARGLGVDAES